MKIELITKHIRTWYGILGLVLTTLGVITQVPQVRGGVSSVSGFALASDVKQTEVKQQTVFFLFLQMTVLQNKLLTVALTPEAELDSLSRGILMEQLSLQIDSIKQLINMNNILPDSTEKTTD